MTLHVNEDINIKIFMQIMKWSHTEHVLQETDYRYSAACGAACEILCKIFNKLISEKLHIIS